MTDAAIERLCEWLDSLSALEPGWYANVGKRTGEQCCAAMRDAAALIRSQAERVKALEEMARSITRRLNGPSYAQGRDISAIINAALNPTGEPT